jgi:hypothetical protein
MILAEYRDSDWSRRNTMLLKMQEFVTVITNFQDYMYGSKDFGKHNGKKLLDSKIYGEIF